MSRLPESIREQVRQRAQKRCEYCRKPETVTGLAHQVDHIRPERHGGNDELSNLAWACFRCNNSKSVMIASYDLDTGDLTPFYDPRKQEWLDHFEMLEGLIVGKTAVGRVTLHILEMNEPRQVKARRLLIDLGEWD